MKEIRKSSLIYHYGVGGLWTDTTDETFLIRAPRYWEWEGQERGLISEPNLKEYLKVRNILFPPGGKDRQIKHIKGHITAGRFPGWHRCKGWRTLDNGKKESCGAMVNLSQKDQLPLCQVKNCSAHHGRGSFAPIRFMAICSNGHLDDFPFQQWVHKNNTNLEHQLRYISMASSGLGGIRIYCDTCSSPQQPVYRNMTGALSPESFERGGLECSGRSPWLKEELDVCEGAVLTGVQKSSSNLLFPIIRNSIFCPSEVPLPNWIIDWLERDGLRQNIINLLPSFSNDPLPILKIFWGGFSVEKQGLILSNFKGIEDYLKPIQSHDIFKDNGYQGIYQREFDRYLNFPEDQKLDDFSISRPNMNEYNDEFRSKIQLVGLMEKLRDTRAYIGFSRITPESGETLTQNIQRCYGTDEVIGDIIRGEGIFLKFNNEVLVEWIERKEVKNRLSYLTSQKREELMSKELVGGIENNALAYMLIHSISHALIGEIAIFSGYNTASVRERIYVGSDGKKGQMYGLLIYTSDGDSEGSLGGLVRLGKPGVLEGILEQALKRATWCSSDPLCSHSIPKGAQGSNLAACHHCILLPETCCETRNEFLDRELIISNNNKNLGFY